MPFAFSKSTDGLKWSSYVSVSCAVIFIFSVIVAFGIRVSRGEIDFSKTAWFWTNNTGYEAWLDIMKVLPQITMAFTYQFNFFSFYKSLDKSSDQKMLSVSWSALVGVTIIYLMTSILGF